VGSKTTLKSSDCVQSARELPFDSARFSHVFIMVEELLLNDLFLHFDIWLSLRVDCGLAVGKISN